MSDLETRLRVMLQERVNDIAAAPEWTTPVQRRRNPLAWLAAAAVVLLVAGGALAISLTRPTASPRPATSSPAPLPTPTPTAQPTPTACAATLPSAWADALKSRQLTLGAWQVQVAQVLPDGTLLITRDMGPQPGKTRDVVLLPPGSSTPQVVFTVPDPDTENVQLAAVSGPWLVIGLGLHPRAPQGTIPGSTPMPNLLSLRAIDMQTGASHRIAATSLHDAQVGGRTIDQATVVGGTVYWDERPSYGSDAGVVKAYDLAHSSERTLYQGPVGRPTPIGYVRVTGARSYTLDVQFPAPAAVQQAIDPNATGYAIASDGSAYAWQVGDHVIGWWAPGRAAPRYVRLRATLQPDTDLEVAGRHVVVGAAPALVLDMTTGAAAPLDAAAPALGGRWWLLGPSGAGLLTGGAETAGKGQWVDGYWQDAGIAILRLDTSRLPAPRC